MLSNLFFVFNQKKTRKKKMLPVINYGHLWPQRKQLRKNFSSNSHKPFKHIQFDHFLCNDFLQKLEREIAEEVEFHEKSTDLYHFQQTHAFRSLINQHRFCKKLRDALYSAKFVRFLSEMTGVDGLHSDDDDKDDDSSSLRSSLENSRTADLFISVYKRGDYLLCHDDLIGTRRLAFLLYIMSDDVKGSEEESNPCWDYQIDGGALTLYDSKWNHQRSSWEPRCEPMTFINPTRNSFAVFEVSQRSFHAVQCVINSKKCRLAIGGWFHGEGKQSKPKCIPLFINPSLKASEKKHDENKDEIKEENKEEMMDLVSEELLNKQKSLDQWNELSLEQRMKVENFRLQSPLISWFDQQKKKKERRIKKVKKNSTSIMNNTNKIKLEDWINPEYLKPSVQKQIQQVFASESSIDLHDWLISKKYYELINELEQALNQAKRGLGVVSSNKEEENTQGHSACKLRLTGPPHRRLFWKCLSDEQYYSSSDPSSSLSSSSLSVFREFELFLKSEEWRTLLCKLTSLDIKDDLKSVYHESRVFDKGHYTVATDIDIRKEVPGLDVHICGLIEEKDGWDERQHGGSIVYMNADSDKEEDSAEEDGSSDDNDDDDPDSNDATMNESSEPDEIEVYSEDDDGDDDDDHADDAEAEAEAGEGAGGSGFTEEALLSIAPFPNSVSLVYRSRDSTVNQFVKFVDSSAPSAICLFTQTWSDLDPNVGNPLPSSAKELLKKLKSDRQRYQIKKRGLSESMKTDDVNDDENDGVNSKNSSLKRLKRNKKIRNE